MAEYALLHLRGPVALLLQEDDKMARLFGVAKVEELTRRRVEGEHFSCNICLTSIGNAHAACSNCPDQTAWDECARCATKGKKCPTCHSKLVGYRTLEDDELRLCRMVVGLGPVYSEGAWERSATKLVYAMKSDPRYNTICSCD